MSKPDWNTLPDWALYIAQEANGAWYFYETRPMIWMHGWWPKGGRRVYCGYSRAPVDHKVTLEKRP